MEEVLEVEYGDEPIGELGTHRVLDEFDGRTGVELVAGGLALELPGVNDDDDVGDLVGDIEWEVFMALNDDLGVHGQVVSGDHVSELEDYDAAIFMLLGDDPVKGNPPASKSYIDNLRKAVLTPEDLGSNEVCAVCKDDLSLHREARKLSCCHCFHWDCIHPWLAIRNTCPVCRYELPTVLLNLDKCSFSVFDPKVVGQWQEQKLLDPIVVKLKRQCNLIYDVGHSLALNYFRFLLGSKESEAEQMTSSDGKLLMDASNDNHSISSMNAFCPLSLTKEIPTDDKHHQLTPLYC